MKKFSLFSWLFGGLVRAEVTRRVAMAVAARDDFRDRALSGEGTYRDRYGYDRLEVLRDSLEAWRLNPLARRIVELTTEYVCGGELALVSDHPGTHSFLQEWWHHRLNRMVVRVFEWCDDLTRSGDLFVVLSTDASGMTYVRAIPAAQIGDIDTSANDLEQETFFADASGPVSAAPETQGWPGYDEANDSPDESGQFPVVMLHYAINRPIGGKYGEPDLAPMLKWLRRHAAWLEDRVRLNHFRQAFLWIVSKVFGSEGERIARQNELNANPPSPGSILVVDEAESWDVKHPQLDSFEASLDGLAIKKMVATGAGVPLHFLAEPESATRTTAEQAGGPAFRHFERRQVFFFWLLTDLARIAVRRRAMVDRDVKANAPISARGTDIFARDNAGLAVAAGTIVNAFSQLRDRGLIDDEEFVRLSYKFAGEIVDLKSVLAAGKKAGPVENAPAKRPVLFPPGSGGQAALAAEGGNGHEQVESSAA